MDLARHDHRVHHIAKIIGSGETFDSDMAGFGVQLDLAGIGPRWIGEVRRVIKGSFLKPRFDLFQRVVMRHIGGKRHIAPSHGFIRPRNAKGPILQLDIRFRGFEQVACDLLGLGDNLFGRAHHGAAAHGQRARAIGAHAHRHLRGVAMDDLDHILVDADHIGHHLRE